MHPRGFRTELLNGSLDEPSNRERWVLSYADFITLMFAFFVVMYSVSSVNDGKFRVLSQTMSEVFSSPEVADAVREHLLERAADQRRKAVATLDAGDLAAEPVFDPSLLDANALGPVLEKLLAEQIADGGVSVHEGPDWTEVSFNADNAFGADAAGPSPAVASALKQIAELARAVDMPVRIEGFTDNVPPTGGIYANNWERSAAQAASIAHALTEAGVNAEQVAASGFGELYPLASNANDAGRGQNRRVVIAIARHADVPSAAVSVAANHQAPEALPARSFGRITDLPGPVPITL